MIKLSNKSDCCGCTACLSICKHNAISFKEDQEGFFYPHFDEEKCIDCGLCEKVCPIIHYKYVPKVADPKIYAAINKNHKQYMQSSSGGIFILLCEYILSRNGIVCGAIYDKDFNVKHSFARTLEECKGLQGSKYVQSDIREIYPKIKSLLNTGKAVLFSGTPCQVAGLKLYLRKDYENLYTVDLICHGVPSPRIFQDYLSFIKGKKHISAINMKSKSATKGTAIRIDFTDGKYIRQTLKTDLWNKLYFGHLIIRPSCHDCLFTHYNRTGDITIGDAWKVNKYFPDFFPNRNLSLIIINSFKGHLLFNSIKDSLYSIRISQEQSKQPQLEYSTPINPKRDFFWKDYQYKGWGYIVKKYLDYTTYTCLKEKIKLYIKKLV